MESEYNLDVYSLFPQGQQSFVPPSLDELDFSLFTSSDPATLPRENTFTSGELPALSLDTDLLVKLYDSGGSATSTCAPSSFPTPTFPPTTSAFRPEIYVNNDKYSPVDDQCSAYFSPLKSPISPATSVMSPLCLTDKAHFDENPEDDDEAPQVPEHIQHWKWVRDYAVIATGTKIWVPQKVYQPYTEADRKRYITECNLRQTIYFFSSDPHEWGITLEDALRFRLKNLQDKDDPMFEGCGPSVSIRIEWPGYRPWTKQIPTMDFKTPKGPITRAKLAKNIANCIRRFVEWAEKQSMEADADRKWRVGRKYIKMEHLMLVSLHHVSKGSWQPQLRLRTALPEVVANRKDGTAMTG